MDLKTPTKKVEPFILDDRQKSYSPESDEEEGNTPSFVLMDVQGDVLVLYVYQLKKDAEGNENVGVEKVSFRKDGPRA